MSDERAFLRTLVGADAVRALSALLGTRVGEVRDPDTPYHALGVTVGLFVVELQLRRGALVEHVLHLDEAGVQALRQLLAEAQTQVRKQVQLVREAEAADDAQGATHTES